MLGKSSNLLDFDNCFKRSGSLNCFVFPEICFQPHTKWIRKLAPESTNSTKSTDVKRMAPWAVWINFNIFWQKKKQVLKLLEYMLFASAKRKCALGSINKHYFGSLHYHDSFSLHQGEFDNEMNPPTPRLAWDQTAQEWEDTTDKWFLYNKSGSRRGLGSQCWRHDGHDGATKSRR